MSDLLQLAERCEAASGPDRELDCRIWAGIKGQRFDIFAAVVPDFGQWQAPSYTASLDAAMGLVPEGYTFVVHGPSPARYYAGVAENDPDAWQEADRDAATPALALCAATLKARAALARETQA